MKTRELVLSALCLVLCACAVGAMAAVEPLKDRTAIQIADSAIAHLDVRTNKVYQLEDTVRVSHSALNWVNQAADPEAETTVTVRRPGNKSDRYIHTDDVPLTVTLKELGNYTFIHKFADGKQIFVQDVLTVVKRQIGTEAEPWIVSKGTNVEVRAFMRSETELCIEGDGTTMADFGGCGPWGDKVESVYFANTNQQISVGAFAGCENLRVVMTKGGTAQLEEQLEKSGFDVSEITFVNLDNEVSELVKVVDKGLDHGRVKVTCVVYDKDAATKEYGSNVKLKLTARGKTVKRLHRLENGGVERDDMMLWLKTDGRPQVVTLIWDAKLDDADEVTPGDIAVSGVKCDDTTVTVSNGVFVGVLDGDTKVRSWKGIPYSQQPTGDNRWKSTNGLKLDSSSDTFAAKQFGHAAIQLQEPSEPGGFVEQGEDCLVLNVWSTKADEPVGYDYGKRPVMVYIHGGGFAAGGSADPHYDGRTIVERHPDVVVVTINYRVSYLGFIDFSGVKGGENHWDAPNLGILDQRTALMWVQNNIEAFGGDKENVTIFGESAGGASVAIHMTSKKSAPYFKRAIQMSGALDITSTPRCFRERNLTQTLVAEVAKLRFGDVSKTNYVDMTVLKSLTVGELQKLIHATVGDPEKDPDWPAWDVSTDENMGDFCELATMVCFPMRSDTDNDRRDIGSVPAEPFMAFATNGFANGKDYMVGTVCNESRNFANYDGPDDPLRSFYTGFLADRIRTAEYWMGALHGRAECLTNFLEAVACERDEMDTRYPGIWKKTALVDQLIMRLPAIKMADIHAGLPADSESGYKGKTYMYRFDKGREYPDQPWAGAGHACELDYVFGNTSSVKDGPINEKLADEVCAAFVNFARYGNPNGVKSEEGGAKSEEVWEEYDTTARKTLLFQNDCTTASVSDPDRFAREMLMPDYDTYQKERADSEGRRKINVPFVHDEDAVPDGTSAKPWPVGKTESDTVIAFTDDTGKLFVEGTGKIRDFYALGGGLWFGPTTTEAEFGPGVTGIGSNMLSNCILLRTIALYPAIPPALGEDALPDDDDLDAIYVQEEYYEAYTNAWPQYQKVIKGVKLGCKELPWKVGVTATDTVAACTNGTERLEIIGEGAMMGFATVAPWASDALTEAVVGAGVTTFGANAFAGCSGLETMALSAAVPPALGAGNDLAGMKIFVPAGTADAYRADADWSDYADAIDEMCTDKGEPLAKHLYEMTYNWWDATKANDVGEMLAKLTAPSKQDEANGMSVPHAIPAWFGELQGALCTSCRNGNFVGRNFDWGYDDVDECVLHIPAAEGRLASIGVASWFFPQWMQDAFDVDAFLPELTMDGVNERGVAINVNVVPGGDNGWTTGTNSNATKRLCAGFAVRTVLDNATNAAHAVEILQARDIYSLNPLEFHWMISDETESYVVECVSNALVVLKAKEAQPKMSNYYVSHSPSVGEYEVVSANAELTADVHTPRAMGIERYANVSNGLDEVDSVEAMFTQMTNVWYKPKYLPGNEKKYWSDLNGAPIPGKSDECFTAFDGPELNEARNKAFRQIQANYEEVMDYEAVYGIRDTSAHDPTLTNGVVHTVHTSVYDIKKRMLRVVVQEDVETMLDVCLTPGAELTPWEVGGDGEAPTKVVGAWTNGTELVIEGSGTVTNLTAIPSAIKSGLTAITIKFGVTGAAPGVFAGFGKFNLSLPDGWQGELPKDGNWYGATGVDLAGDYPLAVKNVKFQQRYPWNGLVDIACDLTGAGEVTLSATVLTNGVTCIAKPTLEGETTVDLDAVGGATNGVLFIWNAAKDLPADFKAQGVQLKVTVEK